MNCPDVRACLPALAYGDLGPAETARVEEHLARCPECRREWAGLRAVRRLLDAAPAPEVSVDVAAVYRRAAERQARAARRWRRVGCAACVGLAAALAVAVGLRLEVQVGEQQVVLRWGLPPAPPAPPAPPPPAPTPPRPAAPDATEERLRLLGELVQALAADVRGRDDRQQQDIEALRRQVQEVQQQSVRRLEDAQRDLDALYQAQFPAGKGTQP
jgi:hypothetical protein